MNPDIYRSTDTSAPTLGNNNGDMVTLLDAILVKGYGTQSITSLTHSAGVITATKTAHGYSNGDVISISGAAPDEYNGRITLTSVADADHFTYAPVGSNPGSSPATGTILGSTHGGKAGLGWQLIDTASNVRCYRARSGSRMYLGVDDNVNVYEVRVRGFETQTAGGVSTATGTGPFPTAAQLSNGVFWQKTNNVAANRAWAAWGDDKRFFITTQPDGSTWNMGFFGDIAPYKVGDAYNCLLIGKATSAANTASERIGDIDVTGPLGGSVSVGHYMPRSYTQAGSAIQVGSTTDLTRNRAGFSGRGTPASDILTFPDPISGGLQLSRKLIFEAGGAGLRGHVMGFWVLCHNFASMTGAVNGDTFNGSDALNSLTFEMRSLLLVGGAAGAVAVETTPGVPWS